MESRIIPHSSWRHGDGFPAGRSWDWLRMGMESRIITPSSCRPGDAVFLQAGVGFGSLTSALTLSTHLRDLSRVLSPPLQGPEPGWVPRDVK